MEEIKMVTWEEIEAAKTPNGGWTRAQLAKWGVNWPPPKGWRKRIQYACVEHTPKASDYSEAERDRIAMKKLYQEKSGDYSY